MGKPDSKLTGVGITANLILITILAGAVYAVSRDLPTKVDCERWYFGDDKKELCMDERGKCIKAPTD